MSIKQVFEKLQDLVLQHLLEPLIILDNYMQERQIVNISDLMRAISVSIQIREPALLVTDMDTKK
jgi:hypothetical protein